MKTRKQETACRTDCRSIGEVGHASQSWAEFICHCSDCLPLQEFVNVLNLVEVSRC